MESGDAASTCCIIGAEEVVMGNNTPRTRELDLERSSANEISKADAEADQLSHAGK